MSKNVTLSQIHQDTRILQANLSSLKEDVLKLSSEFNKSLNEAKSFINSTHIDESQKETNGKKELCPDTNAGTTAFKSIGVFRSCFLTKNGTPRQPGICPYARGTLTITCFNNPQHSLECLSQFSHLWLLFVFHENGENTPKAKVSPPRLNGGKVGVFASRSPHRPNNIGMSLVKLEGISGGTLFLSGVDLIDGTPVLDIKPYISTYDTPSVPPTSAAWITNPPSKPLTINFSDNVTSVMSKLNYAPEGIKNISNRSFKKRKCLRFFRNENELKQSIVDIISADPRSVFRKKQGDTVFSFPVDTVDVKVEVKGEVVTVIDISHSEYVRSLLRSAGS